MNKDLVVKDNQLIEAKYNLTTLEQKVLIKAISLIDKNDSNFKLYQFSVTEFADMLDLNSRKNIYTQLKELCKGLVNNKNFAINTQEGGFIYFNWVASAEYKPKEALIEIEFSQKLKPLLLELKERFTSYYIANVMQLKNSYSIRIFELLKQYEKIKTRTIPLEDLKLMLGVKSLQDDEEKYSQYGHFKSRVLLTAQKELKQKTDIYFDFEEVKENKKVVAITFHIFENVKVKKKLVVYDYDQLNLYTLQLQEKFKEAVKVDIPYDTLSKLIKEKGFETVEKYIDNWDKFKHQSINNVLGFFITAVSQEYTIPTKKTQNNFEQRKYASAELEKLYSNKKD